MAAELETVFAEASNLVESSGGVFEIEDNGRLIFSKKKLGRFPVENEVALIMQAVQNGIPLEEAQQKAAEHAPQRPSFESWFVQRFKSHSKPQQ